MDPQKFEAGHALHCHTIDVDEWMGDSILPEVHNEFFCFCCVKQQVVVLAPRSQAIHLLPVGRLIVVLDEANHCGVVRKLDDGVGAILRSAVVSDFRCDLPVGC